MNPHPPSAEATTPTTTTTSKQWRFWYTLIILGLTAIPLRHDPTSFLYVAVINWFLFYLPAYALVRALRRK